MRETAAKIEEVSCAVGVEDDRVTMAAQGDEATLRVKVPESRPLSEHEPVAELVLDGDGFGSNIELTGDARETLVAALTEGDDV